MDDSLGMKVVQAVKDLSGEELRHVLVEPTLLSQDIGNRTTRDVFEETTNPVSSMLMISGVRTDMLRYPGVSSNPRC